MWTLSRNAASAAAIAAAFAVMLNSGCACSRSKQCVVPGPRADNVKAASPPSAAPDAQVTVNSLSVGSALTVGLVIDQVRTLLADVATIISNTAGEIKSILENLQKNMSQVLSELDHNFKNRTDQLFDRLDEQEKKIIRDAVYMIERTQDAMSALAVQADATAQRALYEASVAAYDAEFNLPCRDRVPRLVFSDPWRLRIWADAGMPGENPTGTGDNRKLQLRVRGNYLTYGPATVTVSGEQADAQVLNPNEMLVTVPAPVVAKLQQNAGPETVIIDASLSQCTGKKKVKIVKSAASLTVLPPLRYSIAARIQPRASLPSIKHDNFSFDDGSNDCSANYHRAMNFSVGPPARVADWSVAVHSANCGSGVVSTSRSGDYSVFVDSHIQGCGRDCFLGICNCKGRGWLVYTLGVNSKIYQWKDLPVSEQTRQAQGSSQEVFNYLHPLPVDRDDLQCRFYVRAAVDDGSGAGVKIYELTEDKAAEGPVAVFWPRDCARLTVTISAPAKTALAAR